MNPFFFVAKVEGEDSAASRNRERRRRLRNKANGAGGGGGGAGGGVGTAYRTPHLPLYPGSWADARELRDILGVPASGVTVLCVDPPARYRHAAYYFVCYAMQINPSYDP